ncbi:MAG: dihydropteroate synthase [Verrucomicrobia bacterium]|jgi:dihydropteroate synthase|nr:dihydropteroate synthase [Verrucomicrobiota bacterium]
MMKWRCREFEFVFPRPALVMGILNVTPDSFSDGGQFIDVPIAMARAQEMIRDGAEIIDVGGESTRPGAEEVSVAEEMRRVLPVIKRLRAETKAVISIDTQKVEVAQAALESGAQIVNDIAANREDDAMWQLVAKMGAGYVAMHMQGTPQTMQANPHYADVVAEVNEFFRERLTRMAAAGVSPEQIALDVGIGFGKKLEHNLQLLAGLRQFTQQGRPLLLGVSRKSFMKTLLGLEVDDRLSAALACTVDAVGQGTNIIRTHDVAETTRAIRMAEAIQQRR